MPKKSKAASLAQRRRAQPQKAGGSYSWFVRITKVVLPLAALALIGIVIARLSSDPQATQLAELPKQEKTVPGQIEIVQAKYEGTDAKGRRYTLTADSATRDMGADQAVLLEKPRADIMLEGGAWLAVHARKGRFDNKAAKLFLTGDVTAYHDSGYELRLKDVAVDLGARTLVSRTPVSLQGPMGELHAQNLAVAAQGDIVVFGGPARVILHRMKPPKGERG